MIIPAKETVRDNLAFRLMTPASISSPTKNKKRQRPIFADRERYGLDWVGNTCSVNPGIRPNAVGPSKIPPARLVKKGSGLNTAVRLTQYFRNDFRLPDLCKAQGKELGCQDDDTWAKEKQ